MLEAKFRASDRHKPLHGHSVPAIPREGIITITRACVVMYSEAVYVTITEPVIVEHYPAYYGSIS